jgi:uncharacterized protein YjbI with pentapeptide repeats
MAQRTEIEPDPPDLPAELDDPLLLGPGKVTGLVLEELRLEGVELSDRDYPNLELKDVELMRCNLANLRAPGARWLRTHVESCGLTGLACSEGRLHHVTFADLRADLASFGATELDTVLFRDCRLGQVDFSDARLQRVRFESCDLSEADFARVTCREVQFEDCRLDRIRGVEDLRGAAMTHADMLAAAATFAAALGIEPLDS